MEGFALAAEVGRGMMPSPPRLVELDPNFKGGTDKGLWEGVRWRTPRVAELGGRKVDATEFAGDCNVTYPVDPAHALTCSEGVAGSNP